MSVSMARSFNFAACHAALQGPKAEQASPKSTFHGSRHTLSGRPLSIRSTQCRPRTALAVKAVKVDDIAFGVAEFKGTGRPTMEDGFSYAVGDADGFSFFGVYDGHGGSACATRVAQRLWPIFEEKIKAGLGKEDLQTTTYKAYLAMDEELLASPDGFWGGFKERGVGGSKCGACSATALLYNGSDGAMHVVTANVGDSRVVLSRGGQALQLSFDHKPDVEEERLRIERNNPFPKQPLVKFVGGTWRVGGLLALSRAFGDAYLKSVKGGAEGPVGGFGLIAEPDMFVETITPEDDFLLLFTDGVYEVLTNQQLVDLVRECPPTMSLNQIAEKVAKTAQAKGATDDVTIFVVKLK
eukprot:jgi/Mesvir1/28412/Mv13854-RA.1